MAIRKHGAATGRVTGIEGQSPEGAVYDEAAMLHRAAREDWGPRDDQELAAENLAGVPQDDD